MGATSILETLRLYASPENRADLDRAIAAAERGETVKFDPASLSDTWRRLSEAAEAELSSIRETNYLLSNPSNREMLERGVKFFEQGGRGTVISPDDLWVQRGRRGAPEALAPGRLVEAQTHQRDHEGDRG